MTERNALITGCSSGIGRATALHLLAQGWTVYATARRPGSIDDLEEAGCRALLLDVTDEETMQAAVDTVEAEQGAVGALVNNAGYGLYGAVEELDMGDLRKQFETNVFGAIRLCQLVLPGMRQRGRGRILNVSSMGGRLTFPGGGAYHATKHALEAFSDALRFEVAGFGVHVVLIEPGIIRTGFSSAATSTMGEAEAGPYGRFDAEVETSLVEVYEQGPLARLGGGPESVAKAIHKALTARSPKARYPVTLSAHLMIGLRAWLPDWAWDAMMRNTFPQPGA